MNLRVIEPEQPNVEIEQETETETEELQQNGIRSLIRAAIQEFFHSLKFGTKLLLSHRSLLWLIPAYTFPLGSFIYLFYFNLSRLYLIFFFFFLFFWFFLVVIFKFLFFS